VRHLVDEIPLVDLAEEVGYSRKTVGKKFRRAMARLRSPAKGAPIPVTGSTCLSPSFVSSTCGCRRHRPRERLCHPPCQRQLELVHGVSVTVFPSTSCTNDGIKGIRASDKIFRPQMEYIPSSRH